MEENRLRSSVLLRLAIVALLTLILLIPASIIESLITERAERKDSVVKEVSGKWGNAQTVTGPILTVPVTKEYKEPNGRTSTETRLLHILPDSLIVSGDISTEVRHRGIFEAVLYRTHLTVSGTLSTADVRQLNGMAGEAQWKDAFLTVGVTDPRGIRENVVLTSGTEKLPAKSGVRSNDVVATGITFFPKLSGSGTIPFSFSLDLNGSTALHFVPLGRYTDVSVRSPWKHPSFSGEFLPEHSTVSDAGFSAEWKVLELNRTFPQSWYGKSDAVNTSAFGIRLMSALDEYQQTTRTAKYALLIIALTFLAFFLSEVLSGELFHPVHYSLVGFALLLFYVLVLSLSEHLGFDTAYLLSALAILTMVVLYTRAIAVNGRTPLITGAVSIVLYIFLYVLMQMEDHALLIGSIGLLGSLSAVMYLTRSVDWFSFGKAERR